MMSSYPGLAKLKTKLIVFQNVFPASDSGTVEQLHELSYRRKAIEDFIERDLSGVLPSRCEQDILKLESYLPLLENLLHHTCNEGQNEKMGYWILDLKIRWTSVLTSSSVFYCRSSKFFQVDAMNFELGMTLFLYGAMLREQAQQVLSSDLAQSATLFKKAAGVFNYIAKEVVTNLAWSKERPPEATSPVCFVMSLVSLADAQAVNARKAEETGKSNSLLAKLHYGITEFLVEAIDVLQASEECKDLSSRLLEFVLNCKTLHELKSCKHLVMSLKDDGKIGVAIGILHQALANVKKSSPKEESCKLVFKQIVNDLTVLLGKYEHENNFVWYEKVPSKHDLPLPQSIKMVSPILYQSQKCERTLVFK